MEIRRARDLINSDAAFGAAAMPQHRDRGSAGAARAYAASLMRIAAEYQVRLPASE